MSRRWAACSARRASTAATRPTWGVRPGADGPAFDLAFLDPPYAKGLGEQALAKLAAGGWLADGATVVFERGRLGTGVRG
jgi:16S rRNA G966 N2-methylase RsmD